MNRLIFDTETIGNLDNQDSLRVYDIAYKIVDSDFNVLCTRHYFVEEIFFGQADKMKTAYYAEKLPQYFEKIARNQVPVEKFIKIHEQLKKDCKRYDVKEAWAYNARFDRNATNATITALSNGYVKYFMPYGVELCCIQHIAAQTFMARPSYFRFIQKHGLLTDRGNPQTSAEAAYKFITKNPEFVEAHTALEDVNIELEILRYSKQVQRKVKGKKDKKPNGAAWRKVRKAYDKWLDK